MTPRLENAHRGHTLGHLIALTVTSVTPVDRGGRAQVAAPTEQLQEVTGNTIELAYVDQGYSGQAVIEAARAHGIRLE